MSRSRCRCSGWCSPTAGRSAATVTKIQEWLGDITLDGPSSYALARDRRHHRRRRAVDLPAVAAGLVGRGDRRRALARLIATPVSLETVLAVLAGWVAASASARRCASRSIARSWSIPCGLARQKCPASHNYPEYGQMFVEGRKLPYDPEKAKALLTEAGYKGEKIVYQTQASYYTNALEAAQVLVEMWKAVGINADLQVVETSDQMKGEGAQIFNWSNSTRLPDPLGALWVAWGPGGEIQSKDVWSVESRKAFNEYGNALEAETDPAKRKALFVKMLDAWKTKPRARSSTSPSRPTRSRSRSSGVRRPSISWTCALTICTSRKPKETLMAKRLTIVQVSDTHLSGTHAWFTANWPVFVEEMRTLSPDFIVNSGDISFNGPERPDDLVYAVDCHRELSSPWRAIAGNHDVGEAPMASRLKQPVNDTRLHAWRTHVGPSWWLQDLDKHGLQLRMIGLDSALMGSGHEQEAVQAAFFETALAERDRRTTVVFTAYAAIRHGSGRCGHHHPLYPA